MDSIFLNSDKELYAQIFLKMKKIINTTNEEIELSESDDEFDKFDEFQHIYDGLY